MLFNEFLTTFAAKEVENTNLFPFPFKLHVIFAAVALIFFALRFITDKRPFQLIFAIAIPFSLTIWLSNSKVWFYTLGAVELALIVLALISCFIFKRPEPEKAEESTDDSEGSETPEESSTEETVEDTAEKAAEGSVEEPEADSEEGDEE